MSYRKTQFLLIVAGSVATITAGCITGTNTFSSIGKPETQFCNSEDAIQVYSAEADRLKDTQSQFDRVSLNEK